MTTIRSSIRFMLLAIVLLWILFGLAIGSSLPKAPTFDESFYITRGWLFFKTGHLYRINHPPLLSELSGLLLMTESGLPDPLTLEGLSITENGIADSNPQLASQDFMWGHGVNVERVTFLARMTTIWLTLLLGALVWRWSRELYGAQAGPIALLLYALSPNIIAHGRLATLDMGVAVFYVFGLYGWWRYLKAPSLRWILVAGALLGLAQAAKFSAALLVPTMALLVLGYADQGQTLIPAGPRWLTGLFERVASWRGGAWWVALLGLGLTGLVGLVIVWTTFGFDLRPYPLALYFKEAIDLAGLASGGFTRGYLNGQISPAGWWTYHPLAYLYKSPVPELVLVGTALAYTRMERTSRRERVLLLSIGLYVMALLLGSLAVGYRYLLPAVPLLYVYAGKVGPRWLTGERTIWRRWIVMGLVGWLLAGTLLVYPDYLAYFNELVGGPANGPQHLADSNIDWGQDLTLLAEELKARDIDHVYLSYFGQADPAYYGIGYERLPGWPPPPGDEQPAPFQPLTPQPGFYAISVSNLLGVRLDDPNTFAYFRAHEPLFTVGHSIYVYEVPQESPPEWAAQCSYPTASIAPDKLAEVSGLSGLRQIYVDCRTGLVASRGPGWLVVRDIPPFLDLGPPVFVEHLFSGVEGYGVYRIDPLPAPASEPPAGQPNAIGPYLTLQGYTLEQSTPGRKGEVQLTLWWQINETPSVPFSFFAHMLAPDGSLFHAADGLALTPDQWQIGDVLVQQHVFPLPSGTPDGSYTLQVGLYSLDSGERFPTLRDSEEVGDVIVISAVNIVR